MDRQHPRQISRGHCWVCLALLAEQLPGHWVTLFLGCALYVQQSVCGSTCGFLTKLELAAQLASDLFVPPGSAMVRAQCARFSSYRVRSKQPIERIVHLCLWAQTLPLFAVARRTGSSSP